MTDERLNQVSEELEKLKEADGRFRRMVDDAEKSLALSELNNFLRNGGRPH